ncbi:MAG TPA: hypothetical protein VGS28_04735 [Candidatus Saccharimonadales bacterium]|nr:hypothetical protein [Candidatus Saccharimonadales bacterium]
MTYWHKQVTDRPLFPEIEWNRPEQKSLAGRLLIVGGNVHGMGAVMQAYEAALRSGVGECRVVLPDALKRHIKSAPFECLFVSSTPNGGISKEALGDIKAYASWANGILLIGDTGRNSETAVVMVELLKLDIPTLITRDAVDIARLEAGEWLNSSNLCVMVTFGQLQKIFQTVHFPKLLLFSMQLAQLVDTLHKFTITYRCHIITLHQQHLVVASNGKVSTTPCGDSLVLVKGARAATACVGLLQQPTKAFEVLTNSMR